MAGAEEVVAVAGGERRDQRRRLKSFPKVPPSVLKRGERVGTRPRVAPLGPPLGVELAEHVAQDLDVRER